MAFAWGLSFVLATTAGMGQTAQMQSVFQIVKMECLSNLTSASATMAGR